MSTLFDGPYLSMNIKHCRLRRGVYVAGNFARNDSFKFSLFFVVLAERGQ